MLGFREHGSRTIPAQRALAGERRKEPPMMGDVDPGVLWEFAKSRHGDDLHAAAARRASKQARPRGPRLRHRVALAVGDHLIALGLTIKQRNPDLSQAHSS